MDDDGKNLISKIDLTKIRKSIGFDDGPGGPLKNDKFI